MTSPLPWIRIHSLVPYDRGAKARWLMTEMGIPYETRKLNREKKENESPEYLRLNVMGRVPVIEIGDCVMMESDAICMQLADQFPEKGLAPSLSSPDRPKYLQWMFFAASTLTPIQTRIQIIEDIPPGEVFQAKEASLLSDLHDICEALTQGLGKNTFLVANRFSTADICMGYHLYWLKLWPELDVVIQKYPTLVSYLNRLIEMPSAKKADVFSYVG